MPQAVNSELLLYADDTCLIYMGNDTETIEEQLNRDFDLCEWFICYSVLDKRAPKRIRQILTLNTVILKSNNTTM